MDYAGCVPATAGRQNPHDCCFWVISGAVAGCGCFAKITVAGKSCAGPEVTSGRIALAVTFEPVVQGFQADPQGGGGGILVTIEMIQGGEDEIAFHIGN